MTGPKRRLGKGAEGKALALYKRGGIVAIDRFVTSVHVIDAAETPENLALAHAAINMYRDELAERRASRTAAGSAFAGARADDLAIAQRLRDHEPMFSWCETCV